ncbi:co-chaperone GroES [Candidatus Dojkabacteria bacterium]|jgi:chaperonin GroES|nr:co-chaperone GroES [Candidatus Dojkabacteria bacterium]
MLIPTKDYILLTVEKKEEEKTASGIYLPEKIADTPQYGTVVLGEGYETGWKVFFKMWAGTPINYEGVDYLLVHIKDVVAFEGGES